MSCGPAKAMLEMADQVDALNDKIDAAILDSPLGQLNGIKAKAEAEAQGLMDKLNAALPKIKLSDLPFEDMSLQDQFKEVLAIAALGYLQLPKMENKIKSMKNKYGSMDVDIDNLADLLREGAMDLDNLCKMVPNVNTQGIELEVKGVPTSFPDFDPVAMIRKGALPNMPKMAGKPRLGDPKVISKKQADDFLNIELPVFDW